MSQGGNIRIPVACVEEEEKNKNISFYPYKFSTVAKFSL
jgi:hypothetical protein